MSTTCLYLLLNSEAKLGGLITLSLASLVSANMAKVAMKAKRVFDLADYAIFLSLTNQILLYKTILIDSALISAPLTGFWGFGEIGRAHV